MSTTPVTQGNTEVKGTLLVTDKVTLGDVLEFPDGSTQSTGASALIGPQGPQGPVGMTGPQGPGGTIGLPGLRGPDGPVGLTGLTGPQGDVGPTGNDGTSSDVIGPMGPKGDKGDTGPAGPIGPQGIPGTNGTDGINGTNTVMDGTPAAGYTKLANGLIFQWGRTGQLSGDGAQSATQNFPITFPTALLSLTLTSTYDAGGHSQTPIIQSTATSSFTWGCGASGDTDGKSSCYFIAIGH